MVLAAVMQNWNAMQYASDAARGDRTIMHAAIQMHPFALRYATDKLRNDREVPKGGRRLSAVAK